MIEINNHRELPRQYAYRCVAVDNDTQAAVIDNSSIASIYYWRARKMLYIPIGIVTPVVHDTDENRTN